MPIFAVLDEEDTKKVIAVCLLEQRLDKERGLGTLCKLPLEVRTQIWLACARYEFPERTNARLERTSLWIAYESYRILLAERIFTFDLSSYRRMTGCWPSEFSVHDQFGCSWRVSPQFGGGCSTFGTINSLFSTFEGVHIFPKRARIRVAAPQDAGEILMLWNRMRWIANFLYESRCWELMDVIFEFLQNDDISWWDCASADTYQLKKMPLEEFPEVMNGMDGDIGDLTYGWSLAVNLQRGSILSFALSPFVSWNGIATLCFKMPNGDQEECRETLSSISRSLLPPKSLPEVRSKALQVCPQWLCHALDVVKQTRSTALLRLEMLASIDARRNRASRAIQLVNEVTGEYCHVCVGQRNAASAYAPQDRDKMLQKIEKEKHKRRLTASRARRPRYWDGIMEDTPYHRRLPAHDEPRKSEAIGPEYFYSESPRFKSSCTMPDQFDVSTGDNENLSKAFEGKIKDRSYGWPEEVRSIQNFWQSLHHWSKLHVDGIPPPTSSEHANTMDEFQHRHVHHPYELCRCKGAQTKEAGHCFCNDCPNGWNDCYADENFIFAAPNDPLSSWFQTGPPPEDGYPREWACRGF